jgi:hypothetical protein
MSLLPARSRAYERKIVERFGQQELELVVLRPPEEGREQMKEGAD